VVEKRLAVIEMHSNVRILLLALCLFNSRLAVELRTGVTAEPVIREIESAVDHNHCTTRQFQRMSFRHCRVWLVFYGDAESSQYQTSADDGKSWHRAEQPVAQTPTQWTDP
jgi:hypothetical protein